MEQLRRAHASARGSLSEAMRAQSASNARKARLAAHAERMRALLRRNEDLEREVMLERRAVEVLRERLRADEVALSNAFSTVSSQRAGLLGSILPDQLRVQGLNLRMADEQLAAERARAIAQLRAVFPIAAEPREPRHTPDQKTKQPSTRGHSVTARASSSSSPSTSSSSAAARGKGLSGDAAPTAVRVCGLRVPDPSDAVGFHAHELSAGLGTLLHFVTLASRYLAAPTLHRGAPRWGGVPGWVTCVSSTLTVCSYVYRISRSCPSSGWKMLGGPEWISSLSVSCLSLSTTLRRFGFSHP